ncbi:MAG: hypothetical protein AM326_07985 [Candidatus Thorarchaeota archaeon SMTZ-45]|nr:MAG: hypothetical protein AM326_07985 [Candidatus Thorarchaeota archaeon SMTZ-45]
MGNLVLLLIQSPFDIPLPDTWFSTLGEILNALFALAIRGYLIFILIGMMIYATGLSDGLAKSLVAAGIGVETITLESATSAWLHLLGMTDAEIISILVWLGDAIVAICLLAGAILYFTPSANDMTGKGKSLIVRALLLAPILAFFHVAAWL